MEEPMKCSANFVLFPMIMITPLYHRPRKGERRRARQTSLAQKKARRRRPTDDL
jgi:hypothetical protein